MALNAYKSKSPRTTRAQSLQPTELFVIQSSFQKGDGPQPRALKRRNQKYMLPRSPESPTPRERQGSESRSIPKSSSVHRRTKDCFVSIDVSQLEIEPFQLADAAAAAAASNPISSWSPILSEEQTKSMDVRRAPTFDPSQKHVTSFSLLRSLDLFPAIGLTPTDFWSLFSRCQVCSNYMTTRTIPYHKCPASEVLDTSGGPANASLHLQTVSILNLRAFDAHDIRNEAGVSEEDFVAAFYTCRQCGRYMTRRMSSPHNDSEFDKDYSGKCIYLQQANSIQDGTNE